MNIFNEVLYRPLFNAMVYLQGVIPGGDLGLTIVILTTIIRILFIPLSLKTIRSQQLLKEIAPRVEEIKLKLKNDTAAQSAAVLKLYKENNINPAAGCLPLLIQLPILIALYQVFIKGTTQETLGLLYGFISAPAVVNNEFLGIFDVAVKSPLLTIIAGGLQFLQSRHGAALQLGGGNPSTGGGKEMAAISKQMLYFFPVMVIIIGWNLPAGLILYWITTTIFSIFESRFASRKA